jgi:hypothetical protein
LGEVAKNAHAAFADGWGLALMYVLADRKPTVTMAIGYGNVGNSTAAVCRRVDQERVEVCRQLRRFERRCRKAVVGTGRFELPTCRLGGDRSIHLSYVPALNRSLPASQPFRPDVAAEVHAGKGDLFDGSVGLLECARQRGVPCSNA